MACYGKNGIDVRAKVIELQQEWERSCAFLSQLEAGISERTASRELPDIQPAGWAEAVEDEEDASESQKYEDFSNRGNRIIELPNDVMCQRGDGIKMQRRRPSVSQIHMTFERSSYCGVDKGLVDELFLASGQRPALLPRQPKPPQLQRSMSLQKGPPPNQRARLMRTNTFSNSSIGDTVPPHSRDGIHAEQGAAASSGPTAPSTISISKASSCVPSTQAAITVQNGSAFKTTRRFSMDHEQFRISPALLPSVWGAGGGGVAQRRISAGGFDPCARLSGNGSSAAGLKSGPGGTTSYRRMEIIPSKETAVAAAPAWDGNGTNIALDNSGQSNGKSNGNGIAGRNGNSGGDGTSSDRSLDSSKPAPAFPLTPSVVELPLIRLDTGRLSVHHEAVPSLLRPLSAVAAGMSVVAAATPASPKGLYSSSPTEGLRSNGTGSVPSNPRLLRPLKVAHLDNNNNNNNNNNSTRIGTDVGDGAPLGVSDREVCRDTAFGQAAISLSPRASQPRAILGRIRSSQREQHQHPHQLQSSESGSPSSPSETNAYARRGFRSLSLPPALSRDQQGGEVNRGSAPPLRDRQNDYQQNQLQMDEEGSPWGSPPVLAHGLQGHLRTKSMGALRLKGIPEEGSAAQQITRRSTVQFSSELAVGGAQGSNRLSVDGSNNSNSGSGSTRFAGRLVYEVLVPSTAGSHVVGTCSGGSSGASAVHAGIHRISRHSWASDTFGRTVEDTE